MDAWRLYLQTLTEAEFYFYTALVLFFVALVLWRAYQVYQSYRHIADTPTSRIASAAQGYCELQGWAEWMSGDELLSPFSQQRCVWYCCRIETHDSGHTIGHWQEQSCEKSDELFIIKDETGDCIVLPQGAKVIASSQRRWYGNQEVDRYNSASKNAGWIQWLGPGKRYRFTEELILVADNLYVLGDFKTEKNHLHEVELKKRINEKLTLWKQQPHRYLKGFDFDNNNKIQGAEWNRIREHAKQEVLQQSRQQIHTIRKPTVNNEPYLISALTETELVTKKRWKLFAYLSLSVLLLTLLLIAWQTR